MNTNNKSSLHRLFFKGICDLLRSRNSFLREYYINTLRANEIEHNESISLKEARDLFIDANVLKFEAGDSDIDYFEASIMKTARMITVWLVFWLNLFPMTIAGVIVYYQIMSAPQLDTITIIGFIVLFLCITYVAFIAGAIAQFIFVKPFFALFGETVQVSIGKKKSK